MYISISLVPKGARSNHQPNRHVMTYPEQTLPATRISKHVVLDEAAITRLSADMGAISRSQDSAVQPLLKLCLRRLQARLEYEKTFVYKKTHPGFKASRTNTLLGSKSICSMQPKHDSQKPGVACVSAPTFLTLSRRKSAGDTEPSTTSRRPGRKSGFAVLLVSQYQLSVFIHV